MEDYMDLQTSQETENSMDDISKYLPLYLGQKVKITDGRIGTLTGVYTKAVPHDDCNRVQVYHDDQINWLESDEVKLILRPLSLMTEEEKEDLCKHDQSRRIPGLYDAAVREYNLSSMLPEDFI